jgi:hypothetical protein
LRWALALGRTPNELLAGVTSEDITEMIAYSNLEPWGPLADEFRFGQICATVANVQRDSKSKPDPWTPRDFMPALERAMQGYERTTPATLLADPKAQSDLIRSAIFKVKPK